MFSLASIPLPAVACTLHVVSQWIAGAVQTSQASLASWLCLRRRGRGSYWLQTVLLALLALACCTSFCTWSSAPRSLDRPSGRWATEAITRGPRRLQEGTSSATLQYEAYVSGASPRRRQQDALISPATTAVLTHEAAESLAAAAAAAAAAASGERGALAGLDASDLALMRAYHAVDGAADELPGVLPSPKAHSLADWRSYLIRNPDLRAAGIRTQAAAENHWETSGQREQRQHAPVNIVLRYSACHGLFNQMYAHLSALLLAEQLGADVVLPPAMHRESFEQHFSVNSTISEVRWRALPASTLLDVRALQQRLASSSRRVYEAPAGADPPDCRRPEDAYPSYVMEGAQAGQAVQLRPTVYMRSAALYDLWDRAAEAVMTRLNVAAGADVPVGSSVTLDLPCTFFAVTTLTCLDLSSQAARLVSFNETLVQLADDVVEAIRRQTGSNGYNGAHLRFEVDASDWQASYGGADQYLAEHKRAFTRAGLSRSSNLYIATGLLGHASADDTQTLMTFLAPFAKQVLHKEMFLPAAALQELSPEQEAVVDFLVLSSSETFVGLGSSTFSVFLREYRRLHGYGHGKAANVFVSSRAVGTDLLFQRCTHFSMP